MKRKSVLIIVGAFILTTCYLGMNKDDKIYEKKKAFTSKDEIIQVIDNKELRNKSEGYRWRTTDEFNECLSKRLRATDFNDYYKLEILEKEDLDEKTENDIKNAYDKGRKSYNNANPIKYCGAMRIKAKEYYRDDRINEDDRELDVVFIDEGEGLVIDYFNDDIIKYLGSRHD